MTQPIFSKAISSSSSNKRSRSYLCDASVGRRDEKIEYSGRDQDLHTKKEIFGKALVRSSLIFFKDFFVEEQGF